jgi:hypothetical protein
LATYFKGGFIDRKGKPLDCEPVDCKPVDCEPVDCNPVVEYKTVIEPQHPLSSEEIRFMLMFLKKSTFTGREMENLVVVTMKLQEEYHKVLNKEQKNK